jgi:enoyl-CoA hydratase/carnithine racemase
MGLVVYATEGAVAVLTLNRPPVNALSGELVGDLDAAIGRAEDPEIRAVIITGNPHFAAGADIKGFKRAMEDGARDAQAVRLSDVTRHLEMLPKPVIAAIRGFALGGGCELALACDVRILSHDATLGQPETNLGIIPGAGGTIRLPRLIGVARARELIYSGRHLDAAEAQEIGLADQVVAEQDLDDAAMEAARRWATGPTAAIGAAKRAINEGLGVPLDEALQIEASYFEAAFATEDAREGVAAFVEKRKPTFRGR